MKSKFESLFFWAVFFFTFICLIFWGIAALIFNGLSVIEYHDNLIYTGFCVIGYLFITIYVIFISLIFTDKFPERIKKFEKFKYLLGMLLLLFIEIMTVSSALPDFD